MSEKLCVFCKHFGYDGGSYGWYAGETELGGVSCAKEHYRSLKRPDNEDDFRRIILRGEGCPDYERPADTIEVPDLPHVPGAAGSGE